MDTQDYKTHRRWVPLYHFVLSILILVLLVASGILAFRAEEERAGGFILLGLVIAVMLMFYFCRDFALKAQDRAIRAEENLRNLVLNGELLDSRLTIRQIVGLRFASDSELGALAKRAAEEGLSENDIKKSIQTWRGDFYRV